MNSPLVSIIIPIYNHSAYILECLNSVTKLNYDNFEVLLCDDGSKDDSYLIAEQWVHDNPNIKVTLVKQENQGVCKTLNRLIKKAQGKYITLCASDDSLIADGVKERVEILEKALDVYAVVGDAFLINQDSHVINKSAMKALYKANFNNLKENIVNELILRWSIVGPTLLIKKEAYSKLGMYDETLLVEDREFYLRLLKINSIIFTPIPVASYRVHTGNASRGNIASRLRIIHQVAISNTKHYKDFSGFEKLFLQSHFIDLVLLKCGGEKVSYSLLYAYRAARYAVTALMRKLNILKRNN